MKSKRRFLLLTATAALAAAFALPAGASAGEWTMEGKTLEEASTIELDGTITLHEYWRGVDSCPVHAEVTISNEPEGSGEVTDFDWDPKTCGGWTGALNYCFGPASGKVSSLPWTFGGQEAPAPANEVIIGGMDFGADYYGCYQGAPHQYQIWTGDLGLKPDSWLISSFDIGWNNLEGIYYTEVSGHFDVTPAGVYGYEE